MSAPNIRLTGYIDVPAERLESVTATLPEHIALTRAEPGCLSFEVTPDPEVPGRYRVSELFIDQPAFDAHQARAGASDWAQITAGIPRQYEITEVHA